MMQGIFLRMNIFQEMLERNLNLQEEQQSFTAFYTPPVVIRAMYEALGNMGFSEGNTDAMIYWDFFAFFVVTGCFTDYNFWNLVNCQVEKKNTSELHNDGYNFFGI